jgi:hypothetical protein
MPSHLNARFIVASLTLVLGFVVGGRVRADNSGEPGPYHGPVVHGVDTTTLDGKVMCGYQGWFCAAGDSTNGTGEWRHWCRHTGPPSDSNVTVDLWPDVSELGPDERFATAFTLNGRPAEVFSSQKRATVLRHFQWMSEYGIDGVFVQRFINGLARSPEELRRRNTVLAHCREGANRYGRAYAVMYDLTGLGRGRINEVMEDWRALRRNFTITEDPAYLHHRGKPVVAVWGVGFNDGRDYTLAECRQLIEFLKNDSEAGGCTVILGVPAHWREMNRDAVADPALVELARLADIVSPWTVGRYTTPAQAAEYAQELLKPDQAWCREKGIDYLPVVFPGFSWHNLKGGRLDQIPRRRGQFFWSQFCEARRAGATMLYVAMFDEVDEGTAIFKCTNNVPMGGNPQFVTYEGLPSDYYLKLVNAGARLLRGEIPLTYVPPASVSTNAPVTYGLDRDKSLLPQN